MRNFTENDEFDLLGLRLKTRKSDCYLAVAGKSLISSSSSYLVIMCASTSIWWAEEAEREEEDEESVRDLW